MKKRTGIFKLDGGGYGFRFSIEINGKKIDVKRTRASNGSIMKTAAAAERERTLAIATEKERRTAKPILRMTVSQVYQEYVASGRLDKTYGTIVTQDSIYNQHIKKDFGKRFIDELTKGVIEDYLNRMYYRENYSYSYVRSMMSVFYLILGQAYNRGYLASEMYNTLCSNKGTKIKSPKKKRDDETEIRAFSVRELEILDSYFEGTAAETAYLLGRYCGLRIGECYGLKWDHVNFEADTIYIDRQMQKQRGIIRLVDTKTKNSVRTIYMHERIKLHLMEKKAERDRNMKENSKRYKQRSSMLIDLDGNEISSKEMVNCHTDGRLQTINSFDYHKKKLRDHGLDIKYHHFRHTYGTMLANAGLPQHILLKQMGHVSIETTAKYYLATTDDSIDILKEKLKQL